MEGERIEALVKIRSGPLSDAARLKKYMMVRKGKALLVRALRLLDEENIKVEYFSLSTAHYTTGHKMM